MGERSGFGDQYLSMITDKYKSKAKRMLNFLKTVPKVSWTSMGELKVGDKVIENSHAVDLLSTAVKPASKAVKPPPLPTGWNEFARILKQYNAPRDMVGSAMRKEWTAPSFAFRTPERLRQSGNISPEVLSPPKKRLRADKPPKRLRKTSRSKTLGGLRWETVK